MTITVDGTANSVIPGQNNVFTGNFTFPEGKSTVSFSATDRASNTSDAGTEFNVYVDTTVPVFETIETHDGTAVRVKPTYYQIGASEKQIITEGGKFTLTVNLSDANSSLDVSGIKDISVRRGTDELDTAKFTIYQSDGETSASKDANGVYADGTYVIQIDSSEIAIESGRYTFYVTATDRAGNVSESAI